MKSLKKIFKTRVIIAAIGLVAVSVGVGTAVAGRPALSPAWHYGYYDTIYTDASKTEECGSYNSCTNTRSGCSTPYRYTETIICQ